MTCRSKAGGVVIYEDTRQQKGKHDIKHAWWASHGVPVAVRKLDFGDYMADGSDISVDTKRSVDEIAQNINGKNHERFKNECLRAAAADCRLVVLVENRDGIEDYNGLRNWMNTHCRMCGVRSRVHCIPFDGKKCERHGTRKPIQGPRLATAMQTMSLRYGVDFMFCKPSESARIICELLGVGYERDAGGGAQAALDGLQDAPD